MNLTVILVNGVKYQVTDTLVQTAQRIDEARSRHMLCGFTDQFNRQIFVNPDRVDSLTTTAPGRQA